MKQIMLSEDIRSRLIEAAEQARKNAYAPYSEFQVGAAVLTEDGSIFNGCNVENISFGATVCAERVAVSKAVCEGHCKIRAVAVVVKSPHPPIPPCGVCLQVINEFGPDADIIMANTARETTVANMRQLLPIVANIRRLLPLSARFRHSKKR